METKRLGLGPLEWIKSGVEMKSLFLAICLTFVVLSSVNAQSTLALQEKCAEGAKKYFFEHFNSYGGVWGSFREFGGSKGLGMNHFISHYNKKLDKCFIRIGFSFIPQDKNEVNIKTTEIYNALEGTLLGSFSPIYENPYPSCEVGNKKCNSKEEFEALTKPYMED